MLEIIKRYCQRNAINNQRNARNNQEIMPEECWKSSRDIVRGMLETIKDHGKKHANNYS